MTQTNAPGTDRGLLVGTYCLRPHRIRVRFLVSYVGMIGLPGLAWAVTASMTSTLQATYIVQAHQQRVPQRTIALDVPSAEEVLVCADAERLAQVLASYLSNALTYSAADQPVMVGVHPEGSAAWVWVHDRGPGLPAAEQARIWERFYRVPGIGHQDGASVELGRGLPISRGIVERQGGQVGVARTPGDGASVWFTVPLAGGRR